MQLLRQLEFEDKRHWDSKPQLSSAMLENKDCEPTFLSGWTDKDLSLWDTDEDGKKPGLEKILIAICKNKKDWEKISYLKFSSEIISSSGLALTRSNGKTGDTLVDTSNTHYEIKGISGRTLCTLVHNILINGFETGLFTKRQYEQILIDSYYKVRTIPSNFNSTTPVKESRYSTSATVQEPNPIQNTSESSVLEVKPTGDTLPKANSGTSPE